MLQKWYVMSRFFDNGAVEAQIYSKNEFAGLYGDYMDGNYKETETCDIYVDEFDTLKEAMEWRNKTLQA